MVPTDVASSLCAMMDSRLHPGLPQYKRMHEWRKIQLLCKKLGKFSLMCIGIGEEGCAACVRVLNFIAFYLIKIHMLVIWKLNIQAIFLSSFFCFYFCVCYIFQI